MKLSQLISKIENSLEFKKFKQNNSEVELCAGFFILDFKPKHETYTLDYKTQEKIFSFNFNTETEEITMKEEEIMEDKNKLESINPRVEIDIENLQEICEEEFLNNKIGKKIEKIIAVLQKKEEKTVWNLTCMADGFTIILMGVDSLTGEILKFEKKSLFDIVKINKKK